MPTTKDIASFYDENPALVCGVLTSGFFNPDEKTSLIARFLGSLSSEKVLDVGCGDGKLYDVLAPLGISEYVGIDVASLPLAQASARHPEGIFIQGDMHSLDSLFGPGVFDAIFLLDVWEHSTEPVRVLSACRNVLKPNGSIMVTIPNYLNLCGAKKLWKEWSGTCPRNSWAPFCNERQQVHERWVTGLRLRRTLERVGFRIQLESGFDLIAGLFPSIYGEAGLKGFWAKHSYWHYRLNRIAMKYPITAMFSMYYMVSAIVLPKT